MKQTPVTDIYLKAILEDDLEGLRKLYHDFFPMVRRLVKENNGTENDAKDVFQDALGFVFEKALTSEFRLTSKFSSYLYGVSWNIWRNQLRKKDRQNVTIPEEDTLLDGKLTDVDFEALERRKLYDKHFIKLNEGCQKILLLYFEKTPMKEIAKLLDTTEPYARRKKHLCQKSLTEAIQNDPIYQELM
jgi:RNA polymerase sigma factor (sigma-70 family)